MFVKCYFVERYFSKRFFFFKIGSSSSAATSSGRASSMSGIADDGADSGKWILFSILSLAVMFFV